MERGAINDEINQQERYIMPTKWLVTAEEIKELYATGRNNFLCVTVQHNNKIMMYFVDPARLTMVTFFIYSSASPKPERIPSFNAGVDMIFAEPDESSYGICSDHKEFKYSQYHVDPFTTKAIVDARRIKLEYTSLLDFLPKPAPWPLHSLYVIGAGIILGLVDPIITGPSRQLSVEVLEMLKEHKDFQPEKI